MPNKKLVTWIVVTDGAKARIVANNGPGINLSVHQEYSSTAARQKEEDLVSDRKGRSFDRSADGRHAMEPRNSSKQMEKEKFVQSVVEQVRQGGHEKAFDQLVLVAAPAALGQLRKALSGEFGDRITNEIAKDLTNVAVHDLPAHLESLRL